MTDGLNIVETMAAEDGQETVWNPNESPLYQHALSELRREGMFDEDADYGGALAHAVLELIETFARQGHSGYSAAMTRSLFDRLARFEPLSPITNDPEEWTEVIDGMWQNKRRSTSFSNDGGQTWYDIEDASRSNGARWYSEEETRKWLVSHGFTGDEDVILDTQTKNLLIDEAEARSGTTNSD